MYVSEFQFGNYGRLTNGTFTCTAELVEIQMALSWEEKVMPNTVVIYSLWYPILAFSQSGRKDRNYDHSAQIKAGGKCSLTAPVAQSYFNRPNKQVKRKKTILETSNSKCIGLLESL